MTQPRCSSTGCYMRTGGCRVTDRFEPLKRSPREVGGDHRHSAYIIDRPGKKAANLSPESTQGILNRFQATSGQRLYDSQSGRSATAFCKTECPIIELLANRHPLTLLKHKQYRDLLVIQELYRQQHLMYERRTHQVEERIVNIRQPHVRNLWFAAKQELVSSLEQK